MFLKLYKYLMLGGTRLKRGYGDMWTSRPPFHASLAVHKIPSWGTSSFTRPSFERKMWHLPSKANFFLEDMTIFSSRSSNLTEIFVKKLENSAKYKFISPCFWWKSAPQFHGNLSAHKPPSSGHTYLPEKKLSAPTLKGNMISENWKNYRNTYYCHLKCFQVAFHQGLLTELSSKKLICVWHPSRFHFAKSLAPLAKASTARLRSFFGSVA